MSRVQLLSVWLDKIRTQELKRILNNYLDGEVARYIATPNPEILLSASRDENFKQMLNEMDVNLVDGFGVVLMNLIINRTFTPRNTGVDLVEMLAQLSAEKQQTLLLFGAENGVAEKAAEQLNAKYQTDTIIGLTPRATKRDDETIELTEQDWKNIEEINPSMVAAAFGQKKQERFIRTLVQDGTNLRIATGIGGALDMISGDLIRAPSIIRLFGLEWMWRLVLEPRRLPRILNAVIVFPITVIYSKLTGI